MRTGKYNIITILEDQGLEQFVIPEIQRDYVWQSEDVKDFLDYILQGFRGDESDKPYLGFIYAYNDREYPYKYILIDGQQRITTIFLLLLTIHHKIGKGLPEYMFTRSQIKVEYKVRQATRDFMESLVRFCEKEPGKDFDITDQIWYHSEYDADRTIQNIIANLSFINDWTESLEGELSVFVKFLEEEVLVSYFDIEEARQGEDLYIYMNSRGRQLEPNETLKAYYLATTDQKEEWGSKWEHWQDFFWKNKGNRPDADAGFNDFLKMVQVLYMSSQNQPSYTISSFIRGRTDTDLSFGMLPQTVEELGEIFDSYKWLVDSIAINKMYSSLGEKEDYLTKIPETEKRQIYLLRILPVIAFLSISGCREELTVLRIARFFYNIARKSESIGKDIANQLPMAIRLMYEYAGSKDQDFDVCDLIDYAVRRTTLLNGEEIVKLTLIRDADNRTELEKLLWEIEDYPIFDGEIAMLLRSYIIDDKYLDLDNFKSAWDIFQQLFNNRDRSKIAIALLYYGNTWFQASPYYYTNYDCMDWKSIVQHEKGTYLEKLIEDMVLTTDEIDTIIKAKITEYFANNKLTTVAALKSESRFFHQIAILAAIDYYGKKEFFTQKRTHIAKDTRFTYNDSPFFANEPVLYNVNRYVGEGYDGRLISTMKRVLQDDSQLEQILEGIVSSNTVN